MTSAEIRVLAIGVFGMADRVLEAGTGWEAARWISVQALSAGPERLMPDGLLSLLQNHVDNDPAAES